MSRSSEFSRRQFLTYLGVGSAAILSGGASAYQHMPKSPARFPASRPPSAPPPEFKPIQPSSADELLLPEGFNYQVIAKWGDALGSKGLHGDETFGFNADLTVWFPIDALKGGRNDDEGVLFVSHEYPNPLFVSGYTGEGIKTEAQIIAEKLCVGGSFLHIRRDETGKWSLVKNSNLTRRVTALYPEMEVTGAARAIIPKATGTLANCSGGRTPWHTVLSCEENFQDYNGTYRWRDVKGHEIDERQYGWVVELDPFGELPPLKHSALGRFAHENTAWRIGPTGKLVVYMGDDAEDQHLYKFVCAENYNEKASRAEKQKLLTKGTLYAAEFGKGRWLPIDLERSPALREAGFMSQGEVMIECRRAAAVLGATKIDRPEDCEVHPFDGSVYVALTNNKSHGNYHGQIVRLVEAEDNAEGEDFVFEIFLVGGAQSGMSCPDNLAFDKKGNLWVACDISGSSIGKGAYEPFKNNGVFLVPTSGPLAGDAYQFASGPVACELTGPWFNESEDTLFLAVQHPGETSKSLDAMTSHWPEGGDAMPKPAVVAITGFK